MFGGNFAPRGWAFCDGTLLAISQNTSLFSILGTTYGGDGRTTFALPDLRGRIPMHQGTGPGLSTYRLGQKGGRENVTLNINQLPSHNHTGAIKASSTAADYDTPGTNVSIGKSEFFVESAANTDLISGSITVANTGGNQPVNIENPYLGLNFIIALVGTYPSRN